MVQKINPPTKIEEHHVVDTFDSGKPVLDDWLRKRALQNETNSASRTLVVSTDEKVVVGYITLSAGSISHESAVGKVKRNMPNPVPVMVLGRLAVDQRWQRMGIGSGLLKEGILRSMKASEYIAIKAIVVHALDEKAKRFYLNFGFQESRKKPLTLMITLEEARKTIADLEEDPAI